MVSPRPVLLRFNSPRIAKAAVWGFCLACLPLLTLPVHALDPNKRITQYTHNSWRTQDGSLPAEMENITQTKDGFLWFAASLRGIYRFDGVRFVSWPLPGDPGSIDGIASHSGAILNVYGDRADGLWVLTSKEVLHVKGGTINARFNMEGLSMDQNVSQDPDGSLWVVRGFNSVSDEPLCHLTDGSVKCFGKAAGIPISPVDSILADGKGGFWLGGQTALVHWHRGAAEIYPIEVLKSNAGQQGIYSLAYARDGTLWIGLASQRLGLGILKDGLVQPFVTPAFDGIRVEGGPIIVDRQGAVWVGTHGRGLFRIHGNIVDHYGSTEGLSSDSVSGLYEDRDGIIWAATANGIDSFHDPRVTTFSSQEGLAGKAMGLLATRDGTIWVANSGSLDRIKNGTVSSIRRSNGLPGDQVASLLEDRAGNLWVGVDDGLYLLKDGHFRRLPEPDHKPLGLVVGITEDIDGNIWAECASTPRKLVRIRDFQVQEEFSSSQIPPGHTLAPDPQGGIWIGSLRGDALLRFRQGALETFPVGSSGSPFSHQIRALPDGSVLSGSVDGLVGLRQGKVQRLTTKNGLPCNFVISFVEDVQQRWWLHTECGIVELPNSELQRWWSHPDTVVQTQVYDVLDGARPGRPSFNSAAYSPDGRAWFATGAVVQMVDPDRLSQKSLPLQTYIESVTVDRKQFAATDNLKLSPHPRDLQIDYTSPSFLIPQKVKFRYRLDKYDHDWHDAGTRRQSVLHGFGAWQIFFPRDGVE